MKSLFTLAAAILVVVASTLIDATFEPLQWRDCGSDMATVWGASITPTPQYLGAPWTLWAVFQPLITFNESLEITMDISVSYKGFPVHDEKLWLCNTTNPIAKGDGLGKCPYDAGVPFMIHDTNTIPKFVPFLGPFDSRVSLTSPLFPGKKLACFEWNQTYAGRK